MDLSVIVPIYNEEPNIQALYTRLCAVLNPLGLRYEFIFINDGSRDQSLALIHTLAGRDPRVRYIDFSRNFGHQIAVTAGLDLSLGEAVVIIDADLQDPPELIAQLYQKLRQGYEVVYAKRRSRQGESTAKKLTAKLFYRLLASITHISIPVDTGDFRIVSRKVVEALKQMPEQNKFIRGQISWIGYRQTYVEYDRAERAGGATGYTYSKMIRLALDGITGFSDAPLKAATVGGFLVSGVAFLVGLYTLYSRFVSHDYQPGWASLMVSILFLGGVQPHFSRHYRRVHCPPQRQRTPTAALHHLRHQHPPAHPDRSGQGFCSVEFRLVAAWGGFGIRVGVARTTKSVLEHLGADYNVRATSPSVH